MSNLPPIRNADVLPEAYKRLVSLPAAQRTVAHDRFHDLCDFLTSQEQMGLVPEAHRIFPEKVILPHDSVFLLNWLVVWPDRPLPPARERDELRNALDAEVRAKFASESTP